MLLRRCSLALGLACRCGSGEGEAGGELLECLVPEQPGD